MQSKKEFARAEERVPIRAIKPMIHLVQKYYILTPFVIP
jgi:hypothetical protein